jgi:hypothetical protein
LPRLIFATRWLSLPLWLGLILAQGVYMAQFWVVLAHLIEVAFGKQTARITRVKRTGHQTDTILGPNGQVLGQEPITALTETVLLRVVLALDLKLIDGVMISYRLTRVAEPGQRLGAEGQAGHGHHWHQLDPSAQDLHQRRQRHRQGVDVAAFDPYPLPGLGVGDSHGGPDHAPGGPQPALTPPPGPSARRSGPVTAPARSRACHRLAASGLC